MAYSKWEQVKDKLILIEGWARDGLTNEQIADNLGIGKTTFYKFIKEYPELSEHLKKGKEVIDYQVENALLKRALGYEYEEKTYETEYNKEKKEYIERLTKRVTKQVIPDTTAQIYWLKNRRPEKWRDRINEKQYQENDIEDLTTLAKLLGVDKDD